MISVIIPAYNAAGTLPAAVESVLAQTVRELELIIVNDGSKDETLKIAEGYREKYSFIKVISRENGGAAAARNAGLAAAEGEYIAFLDADDSYDPDFLETLYNAAKKYDADLVRSGLKYVGGVVFGDGSVRERHPFSGEELFDTREKIAELMLGTIGAEPREPFDSRYEQGVYLCLYRTAIIKRAGLVFRSERELLSEDVLFSLEFCLHTERAVGVDFCGYNYNLSGGSLSKKINPEHFDKIKRLRAAAAEILSGVTDEKIYTRFLDRNFQANYRFALMLLLAEERSPELNKRVAEILKDDELRRVLRRYPIGKLPLKQSIFAFAMKHRLVLLMKLLVKLRKGRQAQSVSR